MGKRLKELPNWSMLFTSNPLDDIKRNTPNEARSPAAGNRVPESTFGSKVHQMSSFYQPPEKQALPQNPFKEPFKVTGPSKLVG